MVIGLEVCGSNGGEDMCWYYEWRYVVVTGVEICGGN